MKLCSHCARIQEVMPVQNRTRYLPDIEWIEASATLPIRRGRR